MKKTIYNKTKEDPDSLYAQYTDRLLSIKQGELKDQIHKSLVVKVVSDMGYEVIPEQDPLQFLSLIYVLQYAK